MKLYCYIDTRRLSKYYNRKKGDYMKKIISFGLIAFIILSFIFSDLNKVQAASSQTSSSGIIAIKSDIQTITYGYTNQRPSNPIAPDRYSPGTPSNAVLVDNPIWTADGKGELKAASWISSAAANEGGIGDQWRLFKKDFYLPGHTVGQATIWFAADNDVEVYLDGVSIGNTGGDILGPAPFDPTDTFNSQIPFGATFTAAAGNHTFWFVGRNWANDGRNSNAIVYKSLINYTTLSNTNNNCEYVSNPKVGPIKLQDFPIPKAWNGLKWFHNGATWMKCQKIRYDWL